jgi:hypothetical protein
LPRVDRVLNVVQLGKPGQSSHYRSLRWAAAGARPRPRDVYERRTSRFVADFIGTSNFLDGVIESSSAPNEFVVRTGAGDLHVESPAA